MTEEPQEFKCEHGVVSAVRLPSGTWIGRDNCIRCHFAKLQTKVRQTWPGAQS